MEKESKNIFQNLESLGKVATSLVTFGFVMLVIFTLFQGSQQNNTPRYLVERGKSYSEFPKKKLAEIELLGVDVAYNAIDSIPAEITKLSKLQLIDFSNNLLTDVPKEICDLKDLKSLNLKNNRLSKLPEDFSKCENLTELSIAGNEFKEFPVGISKAPALEALDISQNDFVLSAEHILPLQKLKTLKLSQSQLPLAEQTKLQQSLSDLKIEFIKSQ